MNNKLESHSERIAPVVALADAEQTIAHLELALRKAQDEVKALRQELNHLHGILVLPPFNKYAF